MKTNGSAADKIWRKARDSRWLLFLLDQGGVGTSELYRAFAHRCAERALPAQADNLRPSWMEVLDAVSDSATGAISAEDLQRVGEKAGNAAMAAGSIGLRIGDPGAALLLAIYHGSNPDALAAAFFASLYGAESFRLRALREDPGAGESAGKRARQAERKEQARVLRELAGRPFADGAAADRFENVPLESYYRSRCRPDPCSGLEGRAIFAPLIRMPAWFFVRRKAHELRRVTALQNDVS